MIIDPGALLHNSPPPAPPDDSGLIIFIAAVFVFMVILCAGYLWADIGLENEKRKSEIPTNTG
jgi:hypothetical protein